MRRLIPILILAVALAGCATFKVNTDGSASGFAFSQASTTIMQVEDPDTKVKTTTVTAESKGVSKFFALGIVGNTVRAASNAFLAFMGRNPTPDPVPETEEN